MNANVPGSFEPAGRKLKLPIWLLILVGAILILLFGAKPYSDYLWFRDDAGYAKVFLLQYETSASLSLIAMLVTWPVLYFVLKRAVRYKLVFQEVPNQAQQLFSVLLQFVQSRGASIAWFGAPLLAFLFSGSMGQHWNDWLLFNHGVNFGRKDPIFGLDYAFFIFRLPFIQAVVGYALSIAVLSTILVGGLQIVLLSIQNLVRAEPGAPSPRGSLMIGLAIIALLLGVQVILGTYEAELGASSQFVGPGFSGVQRLYLTQGLGYLLVALGVGLVIEAKASKGYRFLILGVVGTVAYSVIALGVVPSITEGLYVSPNKLSVEAPFAERALKATKFGFDLDAIDGRKMEEHDAPSAAEVDGAKSTFANMRLWDPTVFRHVAEGTQGFKPYYRFNDVDFDRYQIGGQQRMVMLSPRDLELSGLDATAQKNWVVSRLTYTHGFGAVIAPVNEANAQGQPNYYLKDLPPVGSEIPITEPRIYFGYNEPQDDYAVVSTNVDEFDYPNQIDQSTATHRWTGKGGVSIGSLGNKLLYSLALGDFNLLIAPNVTSHSRLLLHRNILERAQLLYPFLTFDRDPYFTVIGGKMIWLLDAYTSSDRLPYGARVPMPSRAEVSYIRNSVKISIDAYTGQMKAFAVQPNEPILRAYMGIYPGLVHPLEEMPAELRAHFRYPEDLFEAQTKVLTTYHVPDGTTFLKNSDAWAIPTERGLNGEPVALKPYFVNMRLPDEKRDEFLLMRPFSPAGKDNMSGWLAAHCDGDQYGKLTLYEFKSGTQILGPAQMENLFVQDQSIAELNRQLNNDQSQIVVGNLLVIPVGSSMVYCESLFLQSRTNGVQAIPELKKVILATKNKIAVANTFDEAFSELFGSAQAAPSTPPATTAAGRGSEPSTIKPQQSADTSAKPSPIEVLKKVNRLVQLADEALRKGDFAGYGKYQKQLKSLLSQAVQQAEQP